MTIKTHLMNLKKIILIFSLIFLTCYSPITHIMYVDEKVSISKKKKELNRMQAKITKIEIREDGLIEIQYRKKLNNKEY